MKKFTEGLLLKHPFNQVMEIYRQFLKPTFYEKKNMGEVFTPFECVSMIIDRIPEYIWTNPQSTFFDPSAGMGGFLVLIYKKLMNSLTRVFRDPKVRHAHIIKNMLFAAELDLSNVSLMKQIFGDGLHIFHGNTITQFDSKKHFGLDNFIVIVGNPPFERPQIKETNRKGGDSLWIDFVQYSLTKWLAPNGYFGMLLPPGWRKPADDKSRSKDLWKLMTRDNTVLWVHMFDTLDSKKVFNNNVSIRFDLIIILKQKVNFQTIIEATDKKTYQKSLLKIPYLPNANLNTWFRLITFKGPKCNLLYSRSVYGSDKNTTQTARRGTFKYPVIHGIRKDGPTFLYTNERLKEGGFGVPKVIFNGFGGWNNPILDLQGLYGLSQSSFAIVVDSKKEGLDIIKYFTEDRLKMFEEDLKWATSTNFIFSKLFRDLPKNFYNL